MTYPSIPDVPAFGGVVSQVMQNAATGTANGTDFDIKDYATVVVAVVPDASYDGTVTFNASPDGTTFDVIQGNQQGTSTLDTSVTCSSGTATIWTFQVAGLSTFRCSIAGDNTNKVTVTGTASNDPNNVPLAATISSTVLGAGTNIVGKVYQVDSGGTNVAGVDAAHNALVSDGGTGTIVVTASSSAVIKAAAGRLCRILTTGTATATAFVYDSTNAASGTIIGSIPATTAIGTMINIQMPAAHGIYFGGASGTPGVTVSFS